MQIVKNNSSLREPSNDLLAIKMVRGHSPDYTVVLFCTLILSHTTHVDAFHIFRKILKISVHNGEIVNIETGSTVI